jgi:hypothetical protein
VSSERATFSVCVLPSVCCLTLVACSHSDCDDDEDCASGLVCFQRDMHANTPPGCAFDPGGSVDADDDFCVDPNFKHPDQVQINSRFWLYIALSEHWTWGFTRTEDGDELGLFESGEQRCDHMWRKHLADVYADDDFEDRPFAAHLSQVTPANRQQISGHISPFLAANKAVFNYTYHRGPAVASTGEPVFLSWQPEPVRD